MLGDSAGAYFHIPPDWITASQMSLVSDFGSNHPQCASLCVCSPLALYKCNASSKQVRISLLSTICHKRHFRCHFSSVQFKQCDKNNTLTTRPSCPLEKEDGAPTGGKECGAQWESACHMTTLGCGSFFNLLENGTADPEKLNYRNDRFFLDPFLHIEEIRHEPEHSLTGPLPVSKTGQTQHSLVRMRKQRNI